MRRFQARVGAASPLAVSMMQVSLTSAFSQRCSMSASVTGGTARDRLSPIIPASTFDGNSSSLSSSLPKGAAANAAQKLLGVIPITSLNINQEMETSVPLFLYFALTNHPEVAVYTDRLIHQVDQANRRHEHDNIGEAYQESGKDAGLAIKLGVVDCLKEPGLVKKFNIDPHMFPVVYFIRHKYVVDKLTGVVEESQVKEAVDAFIEYTKEQTTKEKENGDFLEKMKIADNDDENAMTLLKAARDKMIGNDLLKAKELYKKALAVSRDELQKVNKRYGLERRKVDGKLWMKLRREGCYNSAPQALCGLAMCALAEKQLDEARRIANEVRMEFPFAVRDLRGVAEVVSRVEMVAVTGFDAEKDTLASLLKLDELMDEPASFYRLHLKLALALYIEGTRKKAMEECLRLIRAEPKLLPTLKAEGLVPDDVELGPRAVTPARRLILLFFEALGETDENVVKFRKLLQLYT